MGRLENIIARNRRPQGLRAAIGMAWRGILLVVLLGLLVLTDWALTDDPTGTPVSGGAPGERRIEGVPLLRAPSSAPAQAPTPAAPTPAAPTPAAPPPAAGAPAR